MVMNSVPNLITRLCIEACMSAWHIVFICAWNSIDVVYRCKISKFWSSDSCVFIKCKVQEKSEVHLHALSSECLSEYFKQVPIISG